MDFSESSTGAKTPALATPGSVTIKTFPPPSWRISPATDPTVLRPKIILQGEKNT
jgi:hypothetical protein